jgi:hypothetical protein
MRSVSPVVLAASVAVLAACSDSGTGTPADGTVRFNIATSAAAPAGAALDVSGGPETFTDGTNTLVVQSAQMVLRDIDFHLVETPSCTEDGSDDGSVDGGSGSGSGDDNGGTSGSSATNVSVGGNIGLSHDDDGNDQDCDELRIGPYLLDLPLGAGAARGFSIELPAGSYREVKFKVHKASSATDAAFVSAHPEFEQKSVHVTGTYNGVAFDFTSDVTASQENEFDPPLAVDGTTATDLTLFVDLSSWFLVDGVLVDPAQANGDQPYASQVKNNIKASIRAFEDGDRDGEDDHDEHGSDHQGSS